MCVADCTAARPSLNQVSTKSPAVVHPQQTSHSGTTAPHCSTKGAHLAKGGALLAIFRRFLLAEKETSETQNEESS